jgi:ankyrin repeat protein
MYAASGGHLDTVKVLLTRGADINARAENGFTALMAALSNRRASAVAQELLDRGADIHAVGREGHTALLIAVANDMTEVAERLIALGADVNAKLVDGRSVLQFAKKNGNQQLLQLLRDVQPQKNR